VIFEIAEDELRRAVARMCHATTPGPSGLTEELLNAALGDAVVAQRLCEMVAAIVTNDVTPAAAEALRTCTLVALGKKDGKIRPIAMGESLLKVASAVLLKRFEEPVRQAFEPLQFGVCVPGGVESIAHAVRKEVDEGKVVFTIDAKNAFNTPNRDAIRLALQRTDTFAPFRALFDLEYGVHSVLRYGDDVIASERGVRQGSTLGPLFFCAVMHPLLQDLAARYPEVRVRAYMDDVTLTGSLPDVHDAFRHFASSLLAIQVEVHPAKCEAYACDWSRHDARRLQQVRDDQVAVQEKAIRVLGAIIGSADEASACIASTAAKHQGFFNLVARLPVEEQLALLGTCGVPKMGFAVRTHHPDVSAAGVASFERQLCRAIERLAEVELDPDGRAAASLPVAMGGLGLRDWRPIAKIAYEASRSGKRGKQKVDTLALDAAEQKRLQAAGRVRVDATQPDSAAAFKPPHVNELAAEPLPPRYLSAYLRLRLGMPHVGLPAGLLCDGCGKHFPDPREWMPHVVSCANRTAPNVSTTHTQLKVGVHNLLHAAGVAVEAKEPADYATVQCTGCKRQVHLAGWHAHTLECTASAPTHTRGTDLRFYMEGDGAHVVDFSTITEDVTSYVGKSLAALEDARVLRKTGLYAEQAKRQGEKLHVAVAFAGGFLGAEALKLCRSIEAGSKGRVSAKDATRALRRAVAFGMGATLAAAETRAGVRHNHADEVAPAKAVVAECTDDAAVYAPHQPTPVAGSLRCAADGIPKRGPGRPRKSVSPLPERPVWAADLAPLPSLSPSPPPPPPASRLKAAASLAGAARVQPVITFDLPASQTTTPMVTPAPIPCTSHAVSVPSPGLPQPPALHNVTAAARMTLPLAAPSHVPATPSVAALLTPSLAAPSVVPWPTAAATPPPAAPRRVPSSVATCSFVPTAAMIGMRTRNRRERLAEERQREAELRALLRPRPVVVSQVATPPRDPLAPPSPTPAALPTARAPSTGAEPPVETRPPSPAAAAPTPPTSSMRAAATVSASPEPAAAPAAPTSPRTCQPTQQPAATVGLVLTPPPPHGSPARRPPASTPTPLPTERALFCVSALPVPTPPRPALRRTPFVSPKPPVPPSPSQPRAAALPDVDADSHTAAASPTASATPPPLAPSAALPTPEVDAEPAVSTLGLATPPGTVRTPPRKGVKARKGVKVEKIVEGATARRATRAKAAHSALTEEALEHARLSDDHVESYAALRNAATGVATAPTSRVVDKTTVARLRRALAALVKQGNARNLPDDWEARLQEMHDRAPQPSGRYDAFRGVPTTPRPSSSPSQPRAAALPDVAADSHDAAASPTASATPPPHAPSAAISTPEVDAAPAVSLVPTLGLATTPGVECTPPRKGAKARKGVKAEKIVEGATARRATRAKAAHSALTEEALEHARLSDDHVESYAALRNAATGVATAPTSRVVDKTTVARLRRALAALVKQGNARNLPDDWEARLQEMHDRAPQPSGPYDAFRGV